MSMAIPGDAREQPQNICLDDKLAGMCFMGIDASLQSSGIALINDCGLFTWTMKTKLMGLERLAWLDEQFSTLVYDVKPTATFLEDYAYSKSESAHKIGELGGCIRLTLLRSGVPWYLATSNQVKKFATGIGSSKKDVLMLSLYKRWGLDVPQEDEADATALALMAMYSKVPWTAMHPGSQPTKPQVEVLTKIGCVTKEIRRRTRRL